MDQRTQMMRDFVELIGEAVITVALIGVFVLIFIPIGLALKLFGKDYLQRAIDKTAASYWQKRKSRALFSGELG